jgi:hypothetical protein
MDAIASIGERLSTRIFAAYAGAAWVDARTVMRTDAVFGCARPLPDLEELAGRILAPLLGPGRIVVTQGYIGATATGLSYANQKGYDIAATMDADGQHDPSDVLKGIDELIKRDADLLIGSRLIDKRGMSRVKVLGNKGLSFITYLLFRVNTTDSQSGLRIYSRRALEQLRWKTSGYEFCSEMIWRAGQLGLTIDEYPIKAIYTEYSKAKGQNNWNAVNILKSLIKRRIVEVFE